MGEKKALLEAHGVSDSEGVFAIVTGKPEVSKQTRKILRGCLSRA